MKKSITNSQMLINEKLDLLDNSDEIKQFFSLNEISFWNTFKKTFFKI